ncbi:MAG: hypothetical protein DRH32_03955 [Deltaproteobacteria bacterium]|nr:MAG: hypothetical protein DRH32_03955 [Deltaproteobacteria bacterium]
MTKVLKTAICLAACCLMILTTAAESADGKWELIMSKDGINTYRMTHPGTNICSFKGVGFVDAGMEVIGAILRDIPDFPKWMAHCKHTRILKKIDRNTFIVHYVSKAPFPYMDRDAVFDSHAFYDFDRGAAHITFRTAKGYDFPKQKKYLRITDMEGEYHLEYFGENRTRVTYMHRADPGGNVPVSLANRFEIRYYPFLYIKGMRRVVKQKKYIDAGINSPEHALIERMLNDRGNVERVVKDRLGRYITDPALLDMIFETPASGKILDRIYAAHSNFQSICRGLVDLLDIAKIGGSGPGPNENADAIKAYVADRAFDDFFSLQRLMEDRWLADAIVKDGEPIYALFDMKNDLAREIFMKMAASKTAVTCFLKDSGLADRLLAEPALREKLWADSVLRERLAANPNLLKNSHDFEELIASRINSYT